MVQKINSWIDRAAELAVIGIFMAVAMMGGMQVFARFILNRPLNWSEELQIYGHIWIIFLTVPIAYNRGSHILMTVLLERMPALTQRMIAVLVDFLWLSLGAAIVVFSMPLIRIAAFQRSPAVELPMSYVYSGMIIGGAYLCLVAIRKLVTHVTGRIERKSETGEAQI